ncbi:MAG: ribulose phosphate 3-epimerase (predicted), ribulose-phosphate 3-epimerase [Candidatus Levybacteria bacterium GW2011_GWC1_40_19]|nr:MAG: Ribulose-phosphate 3-epimerase [Candidatus Levybacteria bacterium GW2011_GWA1_39_32]KKR49907.1 MAG: ribulose phosphate 3-epimerase (predicted), ribulose-phosphate 3-epimerase [Candidatus Levybacteria bacterium GW2011_GWC1_40_19]KKR73302.1 MAG: Ribulose-phosphate 3-epimerase [Candidatus Levybacteria bacterium GW2011_GWC2_40_7]KKR95162.1 MAG: Ribulose-phosphate 3-epimerase [Candidatus Levybacteria bacterium GW2011_GWA2_41_15]KKS00891.1 MAG: Ribulose-phosphate 3-epimerase [Candidatus Levyb
MDKIIPGILDKDWVEIERKIKIAGELAQTIHIDLIDGKFADNLTFADPSSFKAYADKFFFEVHLMVEEPINYLDKWAECGFKRFIGHIEKMSSQEEFVAKGQLLGDVGLAIDGNTPLESVNVPLSDLDVLLIMTINAGASARPFVPECLEKIKKARRLEEFIKVEVDGGINDKTIIDARNAGADRFVTTGFIFRSTDPKKSFETLKGLV